MSAQFQAYCSSPLVNVPCTRSTGSCSGWARRSGDEHWSAAARVCASTENGGSPACDLANADGAMTPASATTTATTTALTTTGFGAAIVHSWHHARVRPEDPLRG